MAVMMLAMMLTGCIQNDIGVKMNKDGIGSISTTIGIEKDFYQNLKEIGSDPFEGKTTTEYTHEDYTYVAYTEVKEYSSYEEMEKALLEMTYDTELIENAQKAQDDEMNADNESFDTSSDDLIVVPYYDEPKVPEKDNHIFSSVNIEKNSGIFYSTYTFSASMNPQSNDGLDYDMNEAFKVTLTVEMPEEITQTIYLGYLVGMESEDGFGNNLANCFLNTTPTKNVYDLVSETFLVAVTLEDQIKMDDLYGETPIRIAEETAGEAETTAPLEPSP